MWLAKSWDQGKGAEEDISMGKVLPGSYLHVWYSHAALFPLVQDNRRETGRDKGTAASSGCAGRPPPGWKGMLRQRQFATGGKLR